MLVLAYPEENNNPVFIEEKNTLNKHLINSKVINKNFCKGYCNYHSHSGYLDSNLIKIHNCINKHCPHFYKIEEKKAKGNSFPKIKVIKCSDILELVKEVKIDGFKAMNVNNITLDTFEVEYVSIASIDEDKIIDLLESKTGFNITLKRKNIRYDIIEKLFLS